MSRASVWSAGIPVGDTRPSRSRTGSSAEAIHPCQAAGPQRPRRSAWDSDREWWCPASVVCLCFPWTCGSARPVSHTAHLWMSAGCLRPHVWSCAWADAAPGSADSLLWHHKGTSLCVWTGRAEDARLLLLPLPNCTQIPDLWMSKWEECVRLRWSDRNFTPQQFESDRWIIRLGSGN